MPRPVFSSDSGRSTIIIAKGLKQSCLVRHLCADGAIPVDEPISSTSAREGIESPSRTAESTMEARPQGLKIVAEGVNPIVDIVAIHGLNGHREKTWTAVNDVHWLRDLLPNDIPNTRILCWGYDANTHGSSRVSCQYLYDHARSLVSDLCLERKLSNTTTRPIIFVAHSLGGIIVKSALIHSDAARKGALEEHRSIKLSTYGIIFMGTPHQGGSGVQLGKLLVNIASVFVAADDRILKHLERDSEWLQQQLGQYGPISGDFVTKFAFEEYATPTVLGHLILVVPQASAVVPGAANAEPIVIHADHINMVKFASKEDSGYRTVSGHLRIMVQDAGEIIRSRWDEESRVNAARINAKETFLVSFSLSDVSETEHFVARQDELAEIHKTLSGDGSRRTLVLHGLGGIGKTQLTVAYAKRCKLDYSAVFWLNSKDESSLKQSFAKVARRILREHPSAGRLSAVDVAGKLDEVVEAVKQWLSLPKNGQWLVVYDNYDNPKVPGNTDPRAFDVRKFFPEAHQGAIIITTRSAEVKLGHPIQVGKLKDVRESLQIISHASGRKCDINNRDAVALALELDGLPLALATAGAYLDQVSTSFSDYLRLYRESWLKLQRTSPEVSSYEDRAFYSTWQLSFDHVKQQNELSAKLLLLWAYFNNEDIWFELLRHGDSSDPEWFSRLTEDELSFNQVMRVLCNHGLAEVDTSSENWPESRGYKIHSCVHSWTIHVLNQLWDHRMAGLALRCVGSHVPGKESPKFWITQRRLVQHAARCSYFISKGLVQERGMERLLGSLGLLYADQGKLDEAEKMYQRALQGYEKAWGLEHTSTLNTVNNLGSLYADQGKLGKAEKMYQRALQGKEKAWGLEHTSTLETVNNLGTLYYDQGKVDEAEKMYQRALQGFEKVYGLEHTSTLATVNNLGILYANQGKLDEAEKMYQRALQGKEKTLGPEHTSTLETVNNLGNLYKNQDKLDEAEKMYQRALQGFEKAWGLEHASILAAVNSLGNLYYNQGKLDEAEKMYQRALQGYEKAWGLEHISTFDTVNNLGLLYAKQGKLDEAEKLYQRALQGREKALGPEHTRTLDTVNNLGLLYKNQGKLNEAKKMYQRALHGYEKVWGLEHTSTLNTVNNLGSLYAGQGKLDEAEKMYQRALQGKEKAWGLEHTSTLETVNNLGILYYNQGKLDEAEKMYQRALQGKEKVLGPEHISTFDTVNNLGLLYADQGKLDKAEKMYQRALQGYEKAVGPEYTLIPKIVNNLGSLYADQGKLDEAEKMYQRALQGFKKAGGLEHTSTLETVNNLGSLYASQGKLDEAEKMFQCALQGKEKALGPEHTSTLNTASNLGFLYVDQGKLDEAEKVFQRVMQGYEKVLGPELLSTNVPALITAKILTILYTALGKTEAAEEMNSRALGGLD